MFDNKQMEYLTYLLDMDLKTSGLAALERVVDMRNAVSNIQRSATTNVPVTNADPAAGVPVVGE